MGSEIERPNVFAYLNYRQFMNDMIKHLGITKKYSIRRITGRCGFGSTSFLRMVLDERRNLTANSLQQVALGFGLNKSETDFFERIVNFNQAKTAAEKDRAYQEILSSRKFRQVRHSAMAEYSYFSHWYIVAIYEGLSTAWSKKTTAQMATSLDISETTTLEALGLLTDLGLIERQGRGWIRKNTMLETPPEANSLNIRNLHREMVAKALESIDKIAPHERNLGSITIPLSLENYQDFVKELANFQRRLNSKYSDDPAPTKIYQANFQIFPLMDVE